jgi:hypothetical protein
MNISNRYNLAYANPASSGSNTLIAAVSGQRIKVWGMVVIAAAANTIKFMSASTDISGQMALAINGGFTLNQGDKPWFETVAGEALNINLSASTQVGVTLIYTMEK